MNDTRNVLLQKLSEADRAALTARLQLVELAHKQHLLEPDAEIDFIYYPETCVCSVLALTASEPPIEVGMFGHEGMSDFVVRPGDRSFLRTMVLVPGTAWRMSADDFATALKELPSLNEVTLRFKDASAVQFAFTSFANGSFNIEERLARWLLMMRDRSQSDTLPIIHDLLAAMLCVRRSGVTTGLHVLEGTGAIKGTRGQILIRDRKKLEELAGESYGPAEYAYRRLLTW